MSEQKLSYMASLDQWTDDHVFRPIFDIFDEAVDSSELEPVIEAKDEIRKAIRAKVLESYRNGQAAGPRQMFKR